MSNAVHSATLPTEASTQQLVVDEAGRIVLPQPILALLGVEPGATLSYLLADGVLMLLPKANNFWSRFMHASQVLPPADPWQEEDPAIMEQHLAKIRAQVVRETYGAEFMDELERKYGHLVGTALAPEGSPADHE